VVYQPSTGKAQWIGTDKRSVATMLNRLPPAKCKSLLNINAYLLPLRKISDLVMSSRRFFSLLVCALVLSMPFSNVGAQATEEHVNTTEAHEEIKEEKKFNASEVIFGHIADAHDWHLFTIGEKHVSLPLPVILYSPQRGFSFFSSGNFHHGHEAYNGYRLVDEHYKTHLNGAGVTPEEIKNLKNGKIIAVDAQGHPDHSVKVYDFSITKNVLSMMIGAIIMLLIMTSVAKKYRRTGTKTAPTGFQNALEPVITFVRDEVAKPNLGHKYMKFMPLLLTIFFFIWVNNLLGLLPGGANFTGNIAVTACLALISFVVMVFNGSRHFWGHLFNPPGVPFGIKLLLVPIEIISLFIKPVALMIRLFANMLAGHIITLSIVSMIFIFGGLSKIAGWGFAPVSLAFTIFMFFLELLVAAIQAFIFTNLTAVFLGQAIEEGHGHEDGQDYEVAHNEIIA
jgi:F-type H+-transporting ATPase subunit a